MAGNQIVSLRDIGRAAGVSHVTVSLALRNHPDVALKTRERIQEIATALGYRPDPMLRALAEYRRTKKKAQYQGGLAWMNYFPTPSKLDKNYQCACWRQAAEIRARELGYEVVAFTPTADKIGPERLKRILSNRGIQGLLLPPQPGAQTVLDFDFSGFAVVNFGFTLISPEFHMVANYQHRSSIIAFRKLSDYGYRRIGLVLSRDFNNRTEGNFMAGFLSEQSKLPVKERFPFMIWEGSREPQAGKRFLQWRKQYRPDAVITNCVRPISSVCKEHDLHIPKDFAMAALNVEAPSTGHAGIDQNDLEIGRVAVDTLVGMLYRNELGVPRVPYRILVEGKWRDGHTVVPGPRV
jgi:DNA-binding LacI/PurR family transcriptional regulator